MSYSGLLSRFSGLPPLALDTGEMCRIRLYILVFLTLAQISEQFISRLHTQEVRLEDYALQYGSFSLNL